VVSSCPFARNSLYFVDRRSVEPLAVGSSARVTHAVRQCDRLAGLGFQAVNSQAT
jgi:hypothetical protein